MVKEWKKLISTAHATTRIVHINADLIRELVPTANSKTSLRGKWTVVTSSEGKKTLALEIIESE